MQMMKFLLTLLTVIALLFPCTTAPGKADALQTDKTPVHDSNDPSIITVAPFPYIPNQDTFERLAAELWYKVEPDVRLEFIDWDCYLSAPIGVDVMMYDALFTSSLAQDGYLRPIALEDIECLDKLLPFTLDAIFDRGKVWGIPNLLCADCILYYKDDEAVRNAETAAELFQVIGARKTDAFLPPDQGEGLLMDFKINAPYYYAQSIVDNRRDPHLLRSSIDLQDPSSLQVMTLLKNMVGERIAFPDETSELTVSELAGHFEDGSGRAFLGYSEYAAWMDEIIDEIDVKLISFSANEDTSMFYADVVSINSAVQSEEKFELCKKLLNLLSSEEFIHRLILDDSDTPQYMMPALETVWDKVIDRYPVYASLYPYVFERENYIIRFGRTAYDYFSDAYSQLPALIASYSQSPSHE